MKQKTILLAEDEPTILRIVKTYFEKNDYNVFVATDGEEALKIFNQVSIDLICVDIMMPKLNGFDVIRIIRSSSDVPIIVITALADEDDILKGYSLHVDDYVIKPFNPKVLLAKVNNLLMRIDKNESLKLNYQIGPLEIRFSSSEVLLDKNLIELTKTEFTLLSFFIKNIEKVCSRELLLDEIWGMDVYVDDRIIDAYIKKLRKALAPYKFIKTVFGVGYKFSVHEE